MTPIRVFTLHDGTLMVIGGAGRPWAGMRLPEIQNMEPGVAARLLREAATFIEGAAARLSQPIPERELEPVPWWAT